MCFGCGLNNPIGLRGQFYELENKEVYGVFKSLKEHQSAPTIVHGGVVAGIIDEIIGRAMMVIRPDDFWGYTVELKIRYKKAVPIETEIHAVGRITKEMGRLYEGEGFIFLKDGTLAVEGSAKYFRTPIEQTGFSPIEEEWKVTEVDEDPSEVEY
jgi:acyl-coenzyme A thioesterase PaaI-like protein